MNEATVTKAVWDLATIFNVGRLRTEASLSTEVDYRHPWARDQVAADLAKMFVAEARVFAVEIDESDLQIKFEDHPEVPESLRLRCFWQPETHTIRLAGGRADGAEYQVHNIWQPYMVPEPVSASPFEERDPFFMPRTLTYQLSGWSESDRVWIFSASTPSP